MIKMSLEAEEKRRGFTRVNDFGLIMGLVVIQHQKCYEYRQIFRDNSKKPKLGNNRRPDHT